MTDPHHPWTPPQQCTPHQIEEYLEAPHVPGTWIREAVKTLMVQASTPYLRQVAEHPNTPDDVRLNVIRSLPMDELVDMVEAPFAEAATRTACTVYLIQAWGKMTPGMRAAFAGMAPAPFWELIWKSGEATSLAAFLGNSRLNAAALTFLIQPPLTRDQAEALQNSRFRADKGIIFQVLTAMAQSFQDPATDLVLGHAAPWLRTLEPQDRLALAPDLDYVPMQRLARLWGGRVNPPA